MMGEKIGELRGQRVGMRVIAGPNGPLNEITIRETGKLLGVEVSDNCTYTAALLSNGTMRGGGIGSLWTDDGDTAVFEPNGVGRPVGKGGATQFRGCVYFQTLSQKLSRLNGVCVVFEHDADDNGVTTTRLYEWK